MKNKDRPNYKELTEEKLNMMLRDLKFQLVQSHSFHEKSKVKPENRSQLRKEIARIKTELNRRKIEDER